MSQWRAFKPSGQSLVIAGGLGSSANGQVPGTGDTIRVVNTTTGICYVAFGAGNTVAAIAPTAGLSDYPVLPGAAALMDMGGAGQGGYSGGATGQPQLWVAVWTTVAGNVVITRGDGTTM